MAMGEGGVKVTKMACIALACVMAACARVPLKDNVRHYIETPVGIPSTKSMGEALLVKYSCPCYEIFEARTELRFVGFNKPVRYGSEWEARYFDALSNEKYLVNPDFHPVLALVLTPDTSLPKLNTETALKQIRGNKRGRSWALVDPARATSIRSIGYTFRGPAWRLQYIGPDKHQSKVLRFTIDDLKNNRERIGQVEYAHDLTNGPEFVVRGVRFRIVNVAPDGLITYLVVSDNEQYQP